MAAHEYGCCQRPERYQISWAGATGSVSYLTWVLGSELRPTEEQQVPLPDGPSLQPLLCFLGWSVRKGISLEKDAEIT